MKLDLRKTKASTVVDEMGDAFLLYGEKKSFLSNIEIKPKKIIGFCIRMLLCTVGVISLKYVEKKNITELNARKVIVNRELNQLTKQQKAIEKQIASYSTLVIKSKEFYNKLEIMQQLADNRMLALTGLDHIQSIIPEEVWLKQVDFGNKKFTIAGISTTNKNIQNFVEELEKTELFSSVNLEKAMEDNRNSRYTRRQFIIVSTLK